RRVGAKTGVQDPRREHAVRTLGREGLLKPVAARLQELAREVREACTAESAQRLCPEREARRRPQLGAEHAEREVGVREELLEDVRPFRAELAGVAVGGAQEERGSAVGKGRRSRELGVQILETALS